MEKQKFCGKNMFTVYGNLKNLQTNLQSGKVKKKTFYNVFLVCYILQIKEEICETVNHFFSTVKPVLTATSEQRPLVNNGQTKSGQADFDTNFY